VIFRPENVICFFILAFQDFSTEENKKELWAQNLFICLICKYFGQHDLSD